MKIERAINVRSHSKTRLRDLYSVARIASMTASDIDEAYRELIANLPKGAPQWVIAYLDGYRAALNDRLYEESLVYGGFYEGRFLSTHSSREDYYEKHGVEHSAYADNGAIKARGHYWAHSLKPYFVNGESDNG